MGPPETTTAEGVIVHATTIAIDGVGLLIEGPSGSGKSGLALQLLAIGASLVADDRTVLTRPDPGPPIAAAPPRLLGLIEARGIGLLRAPPAGAARVAAVLLMDQAEVERMPPDRTRGVLGYPLVELRRVDAPWFPAALVLWLRARRPT
jgi:HPr kinase/phosphorylase